MSPTALTAARALGRLPGNRAIAVCRICGASLDGLGRTFAFHDIPHRTGLAQTCVHAVCAREWDFFLKFRLAGGRANLSCGLVTWGGWKVGWRELSRASMVYTRRPHRLLFHAPRGVAERRRQAVQYAVSQDAPGSRAVSWADFRVSPTVEVLSDNHINPSAMFLF